MCNFMVFKDSSGSEKEHYKKRIDELADCIADGYVKENGNIFLISIYKFKEIGV